MAGRRGLSQPSGAGRGRLSRALSKLINRRSSTRGTDDLLAPAAAAPAISLSLSWNTAQRRANEHAEPKLARSPSRQSVANAQFHLDRLEPPEPAPLTTICSFPFFERVCVRLSRQGRAGPLEPGRDAGGRPETTREPDQRQHWRTTREIFNLKSAGENLIHFSRSRRRLARAAPS